MLGSPVDGPGSHAVAAGFAGALALEGRRRLQRHPWLLAPWSRRQVENVREEPGSAG
jgi:hypothetical protein